MKCPKCNALYWPGDGHLCGFDRVVVWGLVALIFVALFGGGVLYGHCMYGDWRCGMPGVQCRIMKEGQ